MKFKNNYTNQIKKYVEDNKLTYYINTMGCAMNENDSNKYAGILQELGFLKSENEDDANLILFNTCTIRENAENTLLGRLGTLKNKKKQNKYIVIVGCMTEQKHIVEKIKKSYPYTDIMLGTNAFNKLPEKLFKVILENKKQNEYDNLSEEIIENTPIIFEDKLKASVSIIYGCNNFCTYCIVPYVRGRERSRKKEDILNDIKELANKGYKEITLLGQNVNSYGKDVYKDYVFFNILEDVENIEGIEIIKFTSPHPKDFNEQLIDVIAKSNKISKQIHLPLQSGSDKILKSMNRRYSQQDYLDLVKKIKEKCKDVTFSTDIIVGFPEETQKDFEETLKVVKEVRYDQIYMFIYSKRTGTKAAEMKDNTLYKDKVKRIIGLKEILKELTNETNEKMLDKEYSVLVEGKSKNNNEYYTGRTNTNKTVIFKATEEDVGKIKKVKIVKNNLWYVMGEIK